LIIGTIELISILTSTLNINSGPLAAIGNVNLNNVGFGIVGLFILTWIVALAVWRFARIEDRWTGRLAVAPDQPLSVD
jgi:nickel/cobalt transporter (NiCoT) family protein